MFKNMKLSAKMFVIGTVAVIALTLLYGTVFVSNKTVNENIVLEQLRNEQLVIVTKMATARLDLTLAAMDAIVDKDGGTIDAELIEDINTDSKFIIDNLGALVELADTDQEKQLGNNNYRSGICQDQ